MRAWSAARPTSPGETLSALWRLLGVVLCLLVASGAWAATVSMTLGVPEIGVGQGTQLVVTVVGAKPSATPQIDGADGLDLRYVGLQQEFHSSPQTGIVQTFRYSYELRAVRPGTFAIGPVVVPFRGDALVGDATLTLTVHDQPIGRPAEEIVARASMSDTELWEGQVAVYEAEVVARIPIRDVQFGFPDFDGMQVIGASEDHTRKVRDPAGDITHVGAAIPLVATGTGERQLAPTTARITAIAGGNLPISRMRHATTRPVPVRVRPLPPAPAGATGLVGDFTLRSRLSKMQGVAVGESVSWTVEILGDGVLDGFELPSPSIPEARVYRDTATGAGRLVDGRWSAARRFVNVLVPTQPGRIELPPVSLVAFSPTEGRYVTVEVEVGAIEVVGQGVEVALKAFGADGGGVDAAPPVELVDVYTWGPSVTPPLAPLVPLGLALSALPVFLVFGLDARDGVRGWWSSRKVRRAVAVRGRGRLANLPADPSARLAVWELALREALADRARVPVARLQREEAIASLAPEVADPVRAAFSALDQVRYAGGAHPDDLQSRVERALDALEGA